ncbi:TIGR00375 family protein [Paenibacillus sp. MWE-103]|uniref:TIGR00375 family protein n=1 Tax=Paenibacillus artemisiicola TaxID=1172618 RepID=A0ABS3W6U8_9BACL|nr:endonuclease Q family protein [Paenibacillus artemisiicola]MBO7744018.1 TIGR00375 family protein [Paenibacillus artemisiicola]
MNGQADTAGRAEGPAPLRRVFADLHLHIGRTERGEPVKISGSRDLTFRNIAHEAAVRKGISLLGVIDCQSPGVQEDIEALLDRGEMTEAEGGGIRYRDTVILLGAEIEVRDAGFGPAHHLVFLPDLAAMRDFTGWLAKHMRNVRLSSQRLYAPSRELQAEAKGRGGLFVPAHVFTPHKSLFGSCSDRLADTLDPGLVDAVELGLSSDTRMAGCVPDLDRYPFLTNSDAHSLAKIGREYNELRLAEPSFRELAMALRGEEGRAIAANYGLNPVLGKYHRTFCLNCGSLAEADGDGERCAQCGSPKQVRGVLDRILELAERAGRVESVVPEDRPKYVYQVPLEFVPGIGRKTLDKLLARFGTEMAILHDAPEAELAETAGAQAAAMIVSARLGGLRLQAGGGGRYGKVVQPD